jgi:Icc-related predicted phosphoesterase
MKSNLKFHICGHIHEAYGQATIGETHYINASVLNLNYEIVNAPVVIRSLKKNPSNTN